MCEDSILSQTKNLPSEFLKPMAGSTTRPRKKSHRQAKYSPPSERTRGKIASPRTPRSPPAGHQPLFDHRRCRRRRPPAVPRTCTTLSPRPY